MNSNPGFRKLNPGYVLTADISQSALQFPLRSQKRPIDLTVSFRSSLIITSQASVWSHKNLEALENHTR
ncbi:MAG: hypothetical protein ABW185_26375 [Sedimenticola sp.]